MSATPRILCADDQQDVLDALRLLLKGEGLECTCVTSPAAVLLALEQNQFDALVMDLNYTRDTTGGQEGLDLLPRVQRLDPELPVVVMTAWSSVEGAVEAMRRGARDYVQKPWDNARLLTTIRTQVELGRALRQTKRLEGETQRTREPTVRMVAQSRVMQDVLNVVKRVAPSDANILITGEHGTGKEVMARLIHAQSLRAARPFVPVNAGGLSEGVFESELFGHVKGAFTDAKSDRVGCFEMADEGTLFLDEIGNMPSPQQAKLLRALQTGEIHRVGSSRHTRVNVRVLSATNANPQQDVEAGRFREDLLYRLNTVEIHLPALRDRREDIPGLAGASLERLAVRYNCPHAVFSSSSLEAMMNHRWPGNVRELEHVVERALLLANGDTIQVEDLALRTRAEPPATLALESMTLDQAERFLIDRAMQRVSGNVSEAARLLGLSRSAMYRRLERWGMGGGK